MGSGCLLCFEGVSPLCLMERCNRCDNVAGRPGSSRGISGGESGLGTDLFIKVIFELKSL